MLYLDIAVVFNLFIEYLSLWNGLINCLHSFSSTIIIISGYNVSIYRLNKSKQISTIFALYVDSLLDYKCIFALYEMMKKRKCFNQLHEIAIKKRELPTRSTAWIAYGLMWKKKLCVFIFIKKRERHSKFDFGLFFHGPKHD